MYKFLALTLIFALLLTGCGAKPGIECLSDALPAREISVVETDRSAEAADFSLRLFQSSLKPGENTLISPLSVLSALAMTANGAEGETRSQMEAVLGMSVSDMNAWLYTQREALTDELKLANSLWFSRNFAISPNFLETNANFCGADVFSAPMDEATKDAVNAWVNENTNGMIPAILDRIPPDAAAYLVNALAFDAQWEKPYSEGAVREEIFTKEDGTEQTAELMFSKEKAYLEDENATGFIKYYAGGRYAFAALLPNAGVSIEDYVNSLTAEHLTALIQAPQKAIVHAALPKFETDDSLDMAGVLKAMGMEDAFDESAADFSGMGRSPRGNLFISRVLHKTFISVAEQGTRAGAATAVEMMARGALIQEEIKTVTLDRPFVYMLIDCEEGLPFFLGTLMDME